MCTSLWIALLVYATYGFMSPDVRILAQIPMQSREACERFAKETVAKSASNFAVTCVNTQTGEIITKSGGKTE